MNADRVPATLTLDDAAREPWDVLVVGAGPSGSVAAREAALGGARTLLVDRSSFPRRKVCGCCLNGAAIRILDGIGLGELPFHNKALPLTEFKLASHGRLAAVPLTEGVSLSRERFDAELINAAVESGAEFLDGTQATVAESAAGVREVALKKAGRGVHSLARVVIVSGGLGCRAFAERDAEERWASDASRVGGGAVLEVSSSDFAVGTIYMACHRNGYVGLVRLEDGRLDVAAALDGSAIKQHGGIGSLVEEILGTTGMNVPEGVAEAKWYGTAKLTQRRQHVYGDRFFVVGDAAGYIEPFTGEGIAWALATGTAVAPFALASVEFGTEKTGPAWEKKKGELLARRMRRCRTVSHLLRYPALVSIVIRVLSRAPGLAKPIVKSLNTSFAIQ